jgi:hypothetical protein
MNEQWAAGSGLALQHHALFCVLRGERASAARLGQRGRTLPVAVPCARRLAAMIDRGIALPYAALVEG